MEFLRREIGKDVILFVELKMMESSREKWIKKHVAFQGAFGGILVL